jgi:lipoprotein-releasing system permease protein
MHEYDRRLAFVHLRDAQALYRLGERVSGLRLRFHDPLDAPRAVRDIALDVGEVFYVRDWTREHLNFFRAIALTKRVMFVILLLVVAVAAFNIVSTLIMVVNDKRSDIAIMRTVGASPRGILGIFMVQGIVIGVVGTLGGLIAGTLVTANLDHLVALAERWLRTPLIDASVYYIDTLPADLLIGDVLLVCGTALCLSLASTLYPAWRASTTPPAETLRHDS